MSWPSAPGGVTASPWVPVANLRGRSGLPSLCLGRARRIIGHPAREVKGGTAATLALSGLFGEMSESQDRAKDEAAIRTLVEDWASSVRRRDLRGILRNHSPNIVMFDVPPPLQSKGLEPYRRTWEKFFSWSRDPVVFDISEMTVTAGTDVAFVTAVMRCAGTEANGVDIELDFRLTSCPIAIPPSG